MIGRKKHLQREREGVADMAPFVWHDEFYKECHPKRKMDDWANPAGRPYRRVAENRSGKLLPNRNAENELPRRRAAFGFGHNTRRG